jgi:hypothetical protein
MLAEAVAAASSISEESGIDSFCEEFQCDLDLSLSPLDSLLSPTSY